MKVNIIFARARNGVIGKDNSIPWELPEDVANFKRLTMGCPVIMGRKTWYSLPVKSRPLPERDNIVVTRQRAWSENGAETAPSLREALLLCEHADNVWVIGGAEIYNQALLYANSAVVTEIHTDFEGDAYAPTLGSSWVEIARETHVSSNGLKFSFVTCINTEPQSFQYEFKRFNKIQQELS